MSDDRPTQPETPTEPETAAAAPQEPETPATPAQEAAVDSSGQRWMEAELYEQVVEERDRYLRALADAETRVRRAQDQTKVQVARANEQFLEAMLPVLGGFNRAIEAARQASSVEQIVTGLELLERQLAGFLESIGAEVIDPAVADEFDPERHEAIYGQPATADVPEGHITAVAERGIVLNGRVLRHARVAVASASLDVEA